MKLLRKITGASLALALVLSVTMSVGMADEGRYTDVAETDWFAEGVSICTDYGIVQGAAEGLYEPMRAINRAEFVTILYRLDAMAKYNAIVRLCEAAPLSDDETVQPYDTSIEMYMEELNSEMMAMSALLPFEDIDFEAYYIPAVMWASSKGYVEGTTLHKFSPTETITREQMMTILYRYQQAEGIDYLYRVGDTDYVADIAGEYGFDVFGKEVVVNTEVLNNYEDGFTVSEYAREGVSWAIQSGYVQGLTDELIGPSGTSTRAQVAVIVARMLNNVEIGAVEQVRLAQGAE